MSDMEKYAVLEDLDNKTLEKLASDSGKNKLCPWCSSAVEQHGDILKCPNCGTQPFETSLFDDKND